MSAVEQLDPRPTEVTIIVPGQPLSQNDAWHIVTIGARGPSNDTQMERLAELLPPVDRGDQVTLPRESYEEARALLLALQQPKTSHASLAMTKEGKEYKARVARTAAMMRPENWDRDNEYVVTCVYFFDSMRPDIDGPNKLILDAMEDFEQRVGKKDVVAYTGLYKNDRQVWEFHQRREIDRKNPRAEITVRLRKPWRPQQQGLL